ncbi:MAG: FapA family protein, partial [bacterium]
MSSDTERREEVVEASTRREAIEKGAHLLDVSFSDVDHKVLDKGRQGILGFFDKPWKIKVWVQPEKKRDTLLDATLEEALKAAEGVDGSFHLEVQGRKIMLTIFPPSGNGEPVDSESIIRHLKQIGLEYCDFDKVKKLVKKSSGEPEQIGQVPPDENFDARYEVKVVDDGLTALMTIQPPRLGGEPPNVEDINRKLKEAEVTEGIEWDVIENMVDTERYNEPVQIAHGREPEKGDDARIKYFFQTDNKPHFSEKEGKVDFRELGLLKNVQKGEQLAEKEPPTSGRSGLTVTGEKIEAESGEDRELKAGKNVRRDDNKFLAEIDGQVVVEDDVLEVHDVYIVEGDVDYSTGNIDFEGTVNIQGNVRDRFRVRAGGDIIVEKGIGKSYLQAENNIIIKEGIRGKGGAQINAAGNLVSEFIEHAGVIAQGNVIVSEMILHSRVDAGEGIYVSGGRGLITGGEVRAGEIISAEEIGSIGTSETRCEVGIDPAYFRQMAKIEEKIISQQEKLDKIERAINSLG